MGRLLGNTLSNASASLGGSAPRRPTVFPRPLLSLRDGPRVLVLVALLAACGLAQEPAEPLDPIQRAIVDSLDTSLGLPGGQTPPALLAAAIKAADVEALAAAERYLARLAALADKAEADRPDMLADLADGSDEADLRRLGRLIRPRQPAASQFVQAILEAGRMRRRDPGLLAKAVADLASPQAAVRRGAIDQLRRVGVDALPVLVPLLDPEANVEKNQRALARGLVARLGADARQPLLDWLGAGQPAGWAGVIEALAASEAEDIERFLLAPALVPDTPPAAQAAARRLLAARRAARGSDREQLLPSQSVALAVLASSLDRLMGPAGLPMIDHLSLEPIGDPAGAAAAFGGSVYGSVERLFWNQQAKAFERVAISPRVARAREAAHLARDLQALNGTDEAAVMLVLLTQLETVLVTGGDPLTVLERVPPAVVREALAGPNGFSIEVAGQILEQAVERGLWQAAAAVTLALAPERATEGPAGSPGTLPPTVRDALVRAVVVPDATLQFAAARTLALAAGEPPYRGSSRVLETLLFAATSTGSDRVVVAHPDLAVAQELAAGVSRFGYEPVVVTTGRQAIFAARGSADTVLVLLAARLATPTALETTQLLQQQGLGGIPPVLVVVDPLDDDGRGKYLAGLILAFCDLDRVAIIDRLESLFQPVVDPETGAETMPARLPDLLAQTAGPVMVDPASRNTSAEMRLVRAREALTLLGRLGRRGQDVSPALETAEMALLHEQLYAPAASLLAAIGRPDAQVALEQEARRSDLSEASQLVARSAFEASVEQWGILLDSRQMLAAYGRYNHHADDTARRAAGEILNVLEAAGRKNTIFPADAAPLRSRR